MQLLTHSFVCCTCSAGLLSTVSLEEVRRYVRRFETLQTGFGFGMNWAFYKKLFTKPASKQASPHINTKSLVPSKTVSAATAASAATASPLLNESLFNAWDHSKSGTIDALELFSALLLVSNGKFEDKCSATFQLFDFDENATLTQDELVMCVKTAVHALCKLTNTSCPSAKQLENVAITAYTGMNCGKK